MTRSGATFATGQIEVFVFGRSDDTPYATAVAEITQEESALLNNGVELPHGWSLANMKRFKSPDAA